MTPKQPECFGALFKDGCGCLALCASAHSLYSTAVKSVCSTSEGWECLLGHFCTVEPRFLMKISVFVISWVKISPFALMYGNNSDFVFFFLVFYSGLNFIDLMVRQGNIDNPPKTPLVPGFECSGIVEALGDSVKGFEVIFSLISGKD